MIQRVQTLYLLAVAALMAFAAFATLGTFYGDGQEVILRSFGVTDAATGEGFRTLPLAILVGISALLPFVNIFLYKNRWLQLRLCFAETVLLLGSQGFIVFYILRCAASSATWKFGVPAAFPLAALVLTILAIRSIVRDDRLVKSLDRLR